MKKAICCLLLLSLLMLLPGCHPKEESIVKPVNFYYRNAEITYGTDDGLISAEIAESAGYENDLIGLLNLYLNGPDDSSFHVTFPSSVRILSISFSEETVYLQLNESYSWLTGLDLTIASACLAKTTMELTGATTVCISADHASLEGASMIIMDQDAILLDTIG